MPLEDIETDEETFQWRRKGWEKTQEAQDQIKDLVRHLRYTDEPLDPLTVFPSGGKCLVVDGHHRLKAYHTVFWSKSIPVRLFQGSLEEAKEAAFEANGKGRRSYTLQERQEKAWADTKRWFFDGMKGLTKEKTARTSGVSQRSVGYMRVQVKKRGSEVRNLTWVETLQGENIRPVDPEWQNKKVEKLREAMLKLDVIHYVQSPDILARALEAISPRLPRALVECWTPIAIEVAQYHELENEELSEAVADGRATLGPPI